MNTIQSRILLPQLLSFSNTSILSSILDYSCQHISEWFAPSFLKYFPFLATSTLHFIDFPATILVSLSWSFLLLLLPFPKLYKSWNASSLTLGRAQTRHPSLSILMSFAISFSLIILNFTYMLTTHKITISAHSCAPNTFVTSPFWCPTDIKVNILRLPD